MADPETIMTTFERKAMPAWPDAYYVIVSLEDEANPVVRAFRITDGEVAEEELQIS